MIQTTCKSSECVSKDNVETMKKEKKRSIQTSRWADFEFLKRWLSRKILPFSSLSADFSDIVPRFSEPDRQREIYERVFSRWLELVSELRVLSGTTESDEFFCFWDQRPDLDDRLLAFPETRVRSTRVDLETESSSLQLRWAEFSTRYQDKQIERRIWSIEICNVWTSFLENDSWSDYGRLSSHHLNCISKHDQRIDHDDDKYCLQRCLWLDEWHTMLSSRETLRLARSFWSAC